MAEPMDVMDLGKMRSSPTPRARSSAFGSPARSSVRKSSTRRRDRLERSPKPPLSLVFVGTNDERRASEDPFQTIAPVSLTISATDERARLPNAETAPRGRRKIAILRGPSRPSARTITVPPASRTLAVVASASSTDTYVLQAGGWPSCISGITPATGLPRSIAWR